MADVVDYRGDYQVFQAFIRVAARAKGYTMVEVETLFLPRNAGESFLAGSRAWKVSAATLTDFPTALREFGRGRREPIDGTLAPQHPRDSGGSSHLQDQRWRHRQGSTLGRPGLGSSEQAQ